MRYKIYGPPGSGKTTELADLTRIAVHHHGAERVLVASLTRAAATEIANRFTGLNLPKDNAGTLHHHCYRALGSPTLVLKHVKEWNELQPHYAIDPEDANDPDSRSTRSAEYPGSEAYADYQLYRHRMRPRDLWDGTTLAFAAAWESWKSDCGFLDFTDLLEDALTVPPPGQPTAGIFDEVQDFSRLEFALLEKWAESLASIAIAGDDDQCIYAWRGADPQAFINFPEDEHKILSQSYRLPSPIHELSQTWIGQISDRMPKDFNPREERGWVDTLPWSFRQDARRILDEAQNHTATGKTVMILASCEYMLGPILSEARAQGIPFHNPYRLKAHHWNPLHVARGTSAGQRLLTYLKPLESVWGKEARMWTGADVAAFSQPLRADLFGGRAPVSSLIGEEEISDAWLESNLSDESFLDLTPSAYEKQILPSEFKRFLYPLAVAERDPKLLRETPRLIVGTIHSVKGAQADVVIISPEISPAEHDEWNFQPNNLVRKFYVGITRAYEGLIVAAGAPRRYALDDLVQLVEAA